MPVDAAQRLVDNVARLLDADRDAPRRFRRTQKGLAAAIGVEPATVNQTLKRRQGTAFRLIHLDAIADYLGTTPADLIRQEHSTMYELTAEEARIIRHWRNWPDDVRARLLEMFNFFAGLLPEEKEQRELYLKWQRLTDEHRTFARQTVEDLLRKQRLDKGKASEPSVPRSSSATKTATRALRRRG